MDKETIKQQLRNIIPKATHIFDNEPPVLRIEGSTTIVGDIHGNLSALDCIIKHWKDSDVTNILFLGDYIDRGDQGAECLLSLLELKIADPDHVFLLRGNHEDEAMNRRYGFFLEIGGDTEFIMRLHHYIFETMPVAAIVDNNIFCVHGGLTGDNDINNITKGDSLQYLWNDPHMFNGMHRSVRGSQIQNFGPNIAKKFLATNNLSGIIRAHQYQDEGYEWWFDNKLLSLFSAPNYCGRENNAAFIEYKDEEIKIITFGSV